MSKEYDPCMHTAEHVLNAVMVRRFACPRCFSTHINPKKSKVDFHFPHDLSEAEVRSIENEVNAILTQDLTVHALPMPREEAAKRFNLSRLPEDAGDSLRIVYVGDPAKPADACPCIGEHVASTAECGRFVWVSHQWEADGGGVLRVRFKVEKS